MYSFTVASVEDVESHLQTQELVEVSVAPKPITMTRAEIYAMHNTLRKELDLIASLFAQSENRYHDADSCSNRPSLNQIPCALSWKSLEAYLTFFTKKDRQRPSRSV